MFNVYALYDNVAEEFLMPFFQKNDKCAIRAYDSFISKPENSQVAKDFNLYRIGVYNSSDGSLCGLKRPEVVKLIDLLNND